MRSPQPAISTAITCCTLRVPICSAASDPQSKRRRAMHGRSSWSPTRPNAAISSGGEWLADAPEGQVRIRFTERNDFGILDHQVAVRPGVEIYIPMRVIANGTGSEVMFTLFRLPDMTDEAFERAAEWVAPA